MSALSDEDEKKLLDMLFNSTPLVPAEPYPIKLEMQGDTRNGFEACVCVGDRKWVRASLKTKRTATAKKRFLAAAIELVANELATIKWNALAESERSQETWRQFIKLHGDVRQ
jgi:hypothetical protein